MTQLGRNIAESTKNASSKLFDITRAILNSLSKREKNIDHRPKEPQKQTSGSGKESFLNKRVKQHEDAKSEPAATKTRASTNKGDKENSVVEEKVKASSINTEVGITLEPSEPLTASRNSTKLTHTQSQCFDEIEHPTDVAASDSIADARASSKRARFANDQSSEVLKPTTRRYPYGTFTNPSIDGRQGSASLLRALPLDLTANPATDVGKRLWTIFQRQAEGKKQSLESLVVPLGFPMGCQQDLVDTFQKLVTETPILDLLPSLGYAAIYQWRRDEFENHFTNVTTGSDNHVVISESIMMANNECLSDVWFSDEYSGEGSTIHRILDHWYFLNDAQAIHAAHPSTHLATPRLIIYELQDTSEVPLIVRSPFVQDADKYNILASLLHALSSLECVSEHSTITTKRKDPIAWAFRAAIRAFACHHDLRIESLAKLLVDRGASLSSPMDLLEKLDCSLEFMPPVAWYCKRCRRIHQHEPVMTIAGHYNCISTFVNGPKCICQDTNGLSVYGQPASIVFRPTSEFFHLEGTIVVPTNGRPSTYKLSAVIFVEGDETRSFVRNGVGWHTQGRTCSTEEFSESTPVLLFYNLDSKSKLTTNRTKDNRPRSASAFSCACCKRVFTDEYPPLPPPPGFRYRKPAIPESQFMFDEPCIRKFIMISSPRGSSQEGFDWLWFRLLLDALRNDAYGKDDLKGAVIAYLCLWAICDHLIDDGLGCLVYVGRIPYCNYTLHLDHKSRRKVEEKDEVDRPLVRQATSRAVNLFKEVLETGDVDVDAVVDHVAEDPEHSLGRTTGLMCPVCADIYHRAGVVLAEEHYSDPSEISGAGYGDIHLMTCEEIFGSVHWKVNGSCVEEHPFTHSQLPPQEERHGDHRHGHRPGHSNPKWHDCFRFRFRRYISAQFNRAFGNLDGEIERSPKQMDSEFVKTDVVQKVGNVQHLTVNYSEEPLNQLVASLYNLPAAEAIPKKFKDWSREEAWKVWKELKKDVRPKTVLEYLSPYNPRPCGILELQERVYDDLCSSNLV
ncbi:hypothetical protein WG66_011059 [Moniliophthora roreri]|nr:hypothetical protein WG66_011059 [Moniliophthora roreri]